MSAKAKPSTTVRQPPAVPEMQPNLFGEAATPAPQYRWSGGRGKERGLVQRTRGAEPDRVVAYLARELGQRIRGYALEHRESVSDVIGMCVARFLEGVTWSLDPALRERFADVAHAKGLDTATALNQAAEQWMARATRLNAPK